jgi:hypothetical protein
MWRVQQFSGDEVLGESIVVLAHSHFAAWLELGAVEGGDHRRARVGNNGSGNIALGDLEG